MLSLHLRSMQVTCMCVSLQPYNALQLIVRAPRSFTCCAVKCLQDLAFALAMLKESDCTSGQALTVFMQS